jgi:nucleoside-diphosphate-sugar epimerase
MSNVNEIDSSAPSARPLVVLGSAGAIGRHLIAMRDVPAAIFGIERDQGQSVQAISSRLAQVPDNVVVIHAAGNVSQHALPCEKAYLRSTANLFTAMAAVRPLGTVLTIGSIAEALDNPSPYAVMKRQQHELAKQSSCEHGIHWVHLLMHNIIGPGQADTLAAGAIGRRLRSSIEKRERFFPIKDGDAVRDWMDIRDACRMIASLAQISCQLNGQPQIEVCTGIGRTVLDLAQTMIRVSASSIKVIPSFDGEVQAWPKQAGVVIGNPTQLRQLIGTAALPKIGFEQSLADNVDVYAWI